MITKIEGTCSYEGCEKEATHIGCGRNRFYDGDNTGRHPNPACYCETHANMVADEDSPEYTNDCPNCGCVHGVN